MVLPSLALVVMAQVFNPPLGSPPFESALAPDVPYEPGPVSVAASPSAAEPTFVAAWIDDRNGLPDRARLVWLERIALDGGTQAFMGLPIAFAARIAELKLATGPSGVGLAWEQTGALQRTFVNWHHVTPDGGVSALQTVLRAEPSGFDIAVVPAGVVVATGENTTGVAFSGAIVGSVSRSGLSATGAVAISPLPDGGLTYAFEGTDPTGGSVSHGVYGGATGTPAEGQLLGLAPGLTRLSPHVLLRKPAEVLRLDLGSTGAPVPITMAEPLAATAALNHIVLVVPSSMGGPARNTIDWYTTTGSRPAQQPLFFDPSAITTTGEFVVVGGRQGDDLVAAWRNVTGAGSQRLLTVGPAARRHPTVAWNGAGFVASVEVRATTKDFWTGALGTPGVSGETTFEPPTAALRLSLVQRTALSAGVAVDRPGGAELREPDGGTVPLPGRLWAVADGLPTVFWGGPTIGQTGVEGAVTTSLPIGPPRCVASVGTTHLFIGESGATLRAWQVSAQAQALELPSLGPSSGPVCTKPSFATHELLAAWAEGPAVRVVIYEGSTFAIRENLTLLVRGSSQPLNPIAMRLGNAIGVAWELERGDDIGFGLVRDGGFERVAQLLDPAQRAFGVGELAMASNPEGTRLAILWSAFDPRVRARVLGGRIVGLPVTGPDAGVTEPDGGAIGPDAGGPTPDAGGVEPDAGADAGSTNRDGGSAQADAGASEPPDAGAANQVVERFRPECGCHAPGGLAIVGLAFAFWRRRRARSSGRAAAKPHQPGAHQLARGRDDED